jgi:hypothetical protein
MLDDLLNRLAAFRRQRDGAGRCVVAVGAHLALEPRIQLALLANA